MHTHREEDRNLTLKFLQFTKTTKKDVTKKRSISLQIFEILSLSGIFISARNEKNNFWNFTTYSFLNGSSKIKYYNLNIIWIAMAVLASADIFP